MKQNLYEILGVKKDATIKEIKDAYRKKSIENHPDKEGGSVEKMAAINHAKDILTDEAKRERYDRTGSDGKEPSFDQRFKQTIDNLLMQIIKEPANDPEKVDVISLMKGSIEDGLADYKKKKDTMVLQLNRMIIIKKRTNSKDNTIHFVLEERIDQCNKAIAKMSDEILYCEECLEFLKLYEYKFEKESPQTTTPITIQIS